LYFFVVCFWFGEGFHNFHHKFQWDYRNGIRWYDFDPGKWAIKLLSFFKLTTKIRKVDEHKILRAHFNGLKSNFQLYFSKIPIQMKNTYQERFKKIQNQANKTYDVWRKFEMNFKILKSKGFGNKFEKNRVYLKRKILRIKYKSILVATSTLLRNLKLDMLKVNN
jgi:stearoyl-CoA desaturase (delta-9 desaturase)